MATELGDLVGEVEHDLARLVGFETVSDRPTTGISSFLSERLEALGFRIDPFQDPDHPDKGSLVARIGPEGTDGLTMSGHMDVVPTEGQPWTSDPFRLTPKGDRLVGRGSADMKGFFAATLQALARIPRAAFTRELALVWTHDEEVGCLGAGKLVDHLLAAGIQLPTACLIGEPTGFEILRMHPGHVVVRAELTGEAAHSSRPDLGINALEDAARVVLAARALADELTTERADLPDMERPWVAFNTASLRSGSAVNIVPDRAVIDFGYRPLPGMHADEVYERLLAAVEALSLRSHVHLAVTRRTPSLLTPYGTPLQGLLAEHASSPGCGACSFATDGGQLARMGTMPLVFGPGSIEVAHKADEYIERDALHRAVDVLETVVRRACTA
jgi:acetylornithine deacetylase